ncbi:hypothetical protein Tsubulata_019170 [Turnera subulata]|uniref:Uncharacterized protein n=1 Tax=Turnera subulata TaxID=218843 RepID=A0A9Q0GCF8_9ROSI|nr:hypothetical protein Tsubulata_019170 [Turnera subulata]
MVQPLEHDWYEGKSRLISPSPTKTRIKVRMTASRLKELMGQVDLGKGNSEVLGRMILQDCLEGKFGARVVAFNSTYLFDGDAVLRPVS